ncbi:hypothetical protein J0871_04570 [Salegentibacter sp. BDJ18]|nr:hypothetical protein [Salegentibacter sp. BDJ18]
MKEKYLIIFIFFLMFGSGEISAQMTHSMPEPQMLDDGGGPVVPPGLPIDFGISALIAAGLALGIHHIKNRK